MALLFIFISKPLRSKCPHFSFNYKILTIFTKSCLEFTSLFFFSIIAYMVLNIISSIFGALLVGFAIAGGLILTGNWENFTYYYYISYFHYKFKDEPWYTPLPGVRNSISFSICPLGIADTSEMCQANVDYLILGFALSAMQILIGLMEFAISIAAAYSCRVFCSANDHVGAVHPRSVHPGAVNPGAIGYQNPGAVMVFPGSVGNNQYPKMATPEMAAPKLDELQIQIQEV